MGCLLLSWFAVCGRALVVLRNGLGSSLLGEGVTGAGVYAVHDHGPALLAQAYGIWRQAQAVAGATEQDSSGVRKIGRRCVAKPFGKGCRGVRVAQAGQIA